MTSLPFHFVLHKGARQRLEVVNETLDSLTADLRADVAASVFLPDYVPATSARNVAELIPRAAAVMADPALHYRESPPAQRGRLRDVLPYLQGLDPYADPAAFAEAVLTPQVETGANLLITPGLTIGIGASDDALAVSAALALESERLASGTDIDLLIGLAVTPGTVSDVRRRNDLLNAIVDDFPEGDILLRLFVSSGSEAYSQYADREVLEGLALITSSLGDNGRRVVLPQLGLAGWLLMARGAHAFGSGVSSTLQSCCERSPGIRRQPLPRYFLPQLLGFVVREELNVIRGVDGYTECECPFCQRLLPGAASGWNADLAGQHYLWTCMRLASEAGRVTDPRQVIAERVVAARRFRRQLQASSVPLSRRSEPRHLAVWSQVVAESAR
jgi:hypothetical protein